MRYFKNNNRYTAVTGNSFIEVVKLSNSHTINFGANAYMVADVIDLDTEITEVDFNKALHGKLEELNQFIDFFFLRA